MNKKLVPYTEIFTCDTETPITLYQKFVGEGVGALLESCEQPKGRFSFIAAEPTAMLRSKGDRVIIEQRGQLQIREGNALEIIKEFMKKYEVENNTEIPFTGGMAGVIGYDIIRQYEKLPDISPDEMLLPDTHLIAITELIAFDHLHHRVILIVLEQSSLQGKKQAQRRLGILRSKLSKVAVRNTDIFKETQKSEMVANMTREGFIDMVKKAKAYIREGDIFQVVLSQRVIMQSSRHPFDLYRNLRQVNPSAYLFYFNFGDYQVAGSSPEMLVEIRKDKVYTCPIAGTRRRGENAKEDALLAGDLVTDEKECAEHIMLVDLGRNDMGRIAEFGSVNVKEFMSVKYYSHVMHLVSLLEGTKKKELDMFDVLSAFLPAGTLSGAPKIRAMEIIEELEPSKRGFYGGAAGYFGFDGDMDMCIAIRTMIIREGKVYLQAGAGIVADSVPEQEYEETRSKYMALVKAVQEE